MNRAYDVIVVGAGPGGATAARAAAQGGLATLLLDRERFPRAKPCAGGVTAAAMRALDFTLPADVIERDCVNLRPSFRDLALEISRPDRVVAMVSRDAFDACLRDKAGEAGVEILESTKVLGVVPDAQGVTVKTGRGEYRARVAIGADGVFSTVAKVVRPAFSLRDLGLAQWADIPCDPGSVNPFLNAGFEVRYGTPAKGYGWIFPKRGHVSVGVGTVVPRLLSPREDLYRFLDSAGLPRPERVRGYFLPLGGRKRRITALRTMLVGDAAGFVDPFTGEGIRYAILSGRLAGGMACESLARNAGSPDVRPYATSCARLFGRDLSYARILAEMFLHFSERMNSSLFRHPALFEHLADVLQGKGTYQQFVGKFGAKLPRFWLKGALAPRN